MSPHRRWSSLVAIGFLFAAAILVAVPSNAIHRVAIGPFAARSFCVEATPTGISVARARELLVSIVDTFELPTGLDTAGVDLTQLYTTPSRLTCADAGAQTTITTGTLPDGVYARATANQITFAAGRTFAWWDNIGTRDPSEISYQGVLAHEIGHVFGWGHEGRSKWSYDGQLPTMADCINGSDSTYLGTPAQEEWGDAAYSTGGTRRVWSANPGFESDFSYWGHSSGTSLSSSYAYRGSRGVRLASTADYLFITHTYDPYHRDGEGGQLIVGEMTASPTLGVAANYRNGAATVLYSHRYMRRNGTTCKTSADAGATFTDWSAVTQLKACPTVTTTWSTCAAGVRLNNSTTNDATAFRARIRGGSAGVYIDRAGSYGGTTP